MNSENWPCFFIVKIGYKCYPTFSAMHFLQFQNQNSKRNYTKERPHRRVKNYSSEATKRIKWNEKGPSHDAPHRFILRLRVNVQKPKSNNSNNMDHLTRQKEVTTRKHSHMHIIHTKSQQTCFTSNHHKQFFACLLARGSFYTRLISHV